MKMSNLIFTVLRSEMTKVPIVDIGIQRVNLEVETADKMLRGQQIIASASNKSFH